MKFENTDVWGFEHALRGMRNPLNSWSKSDSGKGCFKGKLCKECENSLCDEEISDYLIGNNDLQLAQKLIKAGSEHRKFLRQIFVSVDITAPLYWWKEFDTYKVGTVSNSCSTMHTLSKKPITTNCFEMGDFCNKNYSDLNITIRLIWEDLIAKLEGLRLAYLETKDKVYWKELIRLLPEAYLQKRTITLNYENLLSICKQRRGHKLTEWKWFIEWASELPYAKELVFYE